MLAPVIFCSKAEGLEVLDFSFALHLEKKKEKKTSQLYWEGKAEFKNPSAQILNNLNDEAMIRMSMDDVWWDLKTNNLKYEKLRSEKCYFLKVWFFIRSGASIHWACPLTGCNVTRNKKMWITQNLGNHMSRKFLYSEANWKLTGKLMTPPYWCWK